MQIDSQIIYNLAEEQLAAGERVRIAFGGTSMLPTLRESDTIVLEPLTKEPQVGDILLFHHEGRRVVHRLVAIKGDTYILQGDNNIGTEQVHRSDLMARLVAIEHRNGRTVEHDSRYWRLTSIYHLTRSAAKRLTARWLGRTGRRQLRPWYFAALAILMWAPLNGIGIPLDNYILGLRADHLLHASVFIPCTLFLMDLHGWRRWIVWIAAVGIGLLTESVQYLLPYRGFDVNDLIANTLGVTLGWLVIFLVQRHRHDCKSSFYK